MTSKCPAGTGHRVSHLSHPLFSAETKGVQVSHLSSHAGQPRGTAGTSGTVGTEETFGTRVRPPYTSKTTQIMQHSTTTANQVKNMSAPHRRSDGAPNRASTCTDNCARWPSNEKAAGAAEARASQNRAAANRQRGNKSEHQPHRTSLARETIRPNF